MPCRYVIDKERRLVIAAVWGHLTFQEMQAQQDQMLADPDFDPTFDQLADGSGLRELTMSVNEAIEVVGRKMFSKTSRRAWVALQPAFFGMGRLMSTYHEMGKESASVAVFYDLPSALEWLGREDELSEIEKVIKKIEVEE